MLQSLRASRSALARHALQRQTFQRRTFTSMTSRKADLVQDIYLRELKAYKAPAVKPSDAEGHVQKFAMPKAPASPEESNLANELKAYEDQQVEVEGQAAEGQAESAAEDWFEEPEEEEEHKAH